MMQLAHAFSICVAVHGISPRAISQEFAYSSPDDRLPATSVILPGRGRTVAIGRDHRWGCQWVFSSAACTASQKGARH